MVFESTGRSLSATTATESFTLSLYGEVIYSGSVSESYTLSDGLTVEVRNALRDKIQVIQRIQEEVEKLKVTPGYINAPAVIASQLDLRVEL